MNPISLNEAKQILSQYNCIGKADITASKTDVQTAIITLVNAAEYYILGICADNIEQGVDALTAYNRAFHRDYTIPSLSPITAQGIYLKYNTLRDSLYLDAYDGTHRGVLVSCQSSAEDGINDLFGHLPLDLFN
jgi:hypothetical protein